MKNTNDNTGNVKDTKDVIDIDAVTPDNDRKENLTTTDIAESLKDKVTSEAPLSQFPTEANKTDNDEAEHNKEK